MIVVQAFFSTQIGGTARQGASVAGSFWVKILSFCKISLSSFSIFLEFFMVIVQFLKDFDLFCSFSWEKCCFWSLKCIVQHKMAFVLMVLSLQKDFLLLQLLPLRYFTENASVSLSFWPKIAWVFSYLEFFSAWVFSKTLKKKPVLQVGGGPSEHAPSKLTNRLSKLWTVQPAWKKKDSLSPFALFLHHLHHIINILQTTSALSLLVLFVKNSL